MAKELSYQVAVLWLFVCAHLLPSAADAGVLEKDPYFLAVVNERVGIRLPRDYEPSDLVAVPRRVAKKRGLRLRSDTADALKRLMRGARRAGHRISVKSAYRSFKRQRAIFRRKARTRGLRKAGRTSALPGYSQHQLGTAVDLTARSVGSRLSPRLARTQEGSWLIAHAHEYGFALAYSRRDEKATGIAFEPWHYRYVGVEVATAHKASGLSLDEFLLRLQARASR